MTIENSSHYVPEMCHSCGLGLEGVRGRWVTTPHAMQRLLSPIRADGVPRVLH